MDDKILKIVYTFFLGIILALFVGLGISTFYTGPTMPEYPVTSPEFREPARLDTEAQRQYDTQYQEYNEQYQTYHRNVSIISLIAAVVLLVISFLFDARNKVIANGILLGGVFTLIYSIGRGLVSEDSKYTFVAVAISLLIVLYLGYRRFAPSTLTKPVATKKTKR